MARAKLPSRRDKVFSGLAAETRAGHEKGADISHTHGNPLNAALSVLLWTGL